MKRQYLSRNNIKKWNETGVVNVSTGLTSSTGGFSGVSWTGWGIGWIGEDCCKSSPRYQGCFII